MAKRSTKGFIQIKISTVIILLLLLILFTFIRGTPRISKTHIQAPIQAPIHYNLPPPQQHLYYGPRDIFMDPYKPPLKDNKFYTKQIGIPINIPTSTVNANYDCVGILTRMGGKEQILPLFGRPLHFGRNQWQYYAMSDKNNNIKLPISNAGKSCTGEYGCENISNGDTVYVEGYNDTFKATIYENNVPRYIPVI